VTRTPHAAPAAVADLDPSGDIAVATQRGALWMAGAETAIRLLRTAVFIVLARLLLPEDFGLVALAAVVTGVLVTLTNLGFGVFVVQRPQLDRPTVDTAFWTTVAVGAALGAAQLLAAEPLSRLLGAPELAPALRVLAVVPVVAGLSSIPAALLNRQMRFAQLSVRAAVAALASSAAALLMALAGAGLWALVAQTVVEVTVGCVLAWRACPYRPGLQVRWSSLRELLGSGSKQLGLEALSLLDSRTDQFLVGTRLGSSALGVYSVAHRFLGVLQEVLEGTVRRAALASFARMQDDAARLERTYWRLLRASSAVATPLFALAATTSPMVIDLFFGPRWAPAAPVMSALALSGAILVLSDVNTTLLIALGRPGRVLVLNVVSVLVNVAGFLLAVRYGLVAVAAVYTARALVVLPLGFAMARALVPVTARAVARGLGPVLVAAGVPALAGALGTQLVWPALGTVPALAVTGLLALAGYLLALRLLARGTYADLHAMVARETSSVTARLSRRPRRDDDREGAPRHD
jgi:PST family polysaccharide transporter